MEQVIEQQHDEATARLLKAAEVARLVIPLPIDPDMLAAARYEADGTFTNGAERWLRILGASEDFREYAFPGRPELPIAYVSPPISPQERRMAALALPVAGVYPNHV